MIQFKMLGVSKIIQKERNINETYEVIMKKKIEVLTSLLASAFLHQKKMIQGGNCKVPTSEETKSAYLNDPLISKFVDVTVFGIYEILNSEEMKQ